jgi:hypothetical protein
MSRSRVMARNGAKARSQNFLKSVDPTFLGEMFQAMVEFGLPRRPVDLENPHGLWPAMRGAEMPTHADLVAHVRSCASLFFEPTEELGGAPIAVFQEVRLGPQARADLVVVRSSQMVVVEVKRGAASDKDLDQIEYYVEVAQEAPEYAGLAVLGALCAHGLTSYASSLLSASNVRFFRFALDGPVGEVYVRRI